jgi:hypothetical protein
LEDLLIVISRDRGRSNWEKQKEVIGRSKMSKLKPESRSGTEQGERMLQNWIKKVHSSERQRKAETLDRIVKGRREQLKRHKRR